MIPYEDLERHFTTPKHLGEKTFFYDVKRVPRKLKKKMKKTLWFCDHMPIGQRLWFMLCLTNHDYHRFLIKQICKRYE